MKVDRSEFLKRVVLVLALLAFSVLVWQLGEVLLLVFGSLVFAASLVTLSLWVSERTFLSRQWAVGVVCFLLFLISAVFFVLVIPAVSDQFEKLGPQISQSWKELKTDFFHTTIGQKFGSQLVGSGLDQKEVLKRSLQFISGTFGVLGSSLLMAVMCLYFSLDPKFYERGALKLLSPPFRDRAGEILTKLRVTLSWWLAGRLVSMLVVAIFTMIGLWILGLDLALVLGVLAGLLSFIPNIGPMLSLVPAVLVSFPQGSSMVLWVVGIYGLVQLVESYMLTPLVQRRATSLPPALLLLTQVAMGLLMGLWGVLFASPLLACVLVLLKETYLKQIDNSDAASS